MLNPVCPGAGRGPAPVEENTTREAFDGTSFADFNRLSGEEIERLLALCRAPASVWRPDLRPARPPEPFGMIA